jgi:hypothetical protein
MLLHEELQVPELPAIYQREFKTWHNLPIMDKNAPEFSLKR